MDATEGKLPWTSALRLTISLLLAGLICGAVIGLAYVSALLVAPLAGLGIPATACLAAALLIRTEQAMVFLVSRWRPAILSLILAALPGTGVAFVLRGLFRWHGLLGIVFSVGAGLVVQALVLNYLAVASARRASVAENCLGAVSASELAAGRQHGTPPVGEPRLAVAGAPGAGPDSAAASAPTTPTAADPSLGSSAARSISGAKRSRNR